MRSGTWRRLGWAILAAGVAAAASLKWSDAMSSRGPRVRAEGWRLISANVRDEPLAVIGALRRYAPDVLALQETGAWGSCAGLARRVGYAYWSGSDQCVLAAGPGSPVAGRTPWPGGRQPPQLIRLEGTPGVVLVNVHLAKSSILRSVGAPTPTRRMEYTWLRETLGGDDPTLVCGDFNAFPWKVDLGGGFADSWRRPALGATFPAWLPVARIDQCWSSDGIVIQAAWTVAIPSDHRALVVDFALDGSDRGRARVVEGGASGG